MVTEQSNLTTLAALAKGAEARTPLPLPKAPDEGSGLIDIKEIERRAKEQRVQLELARASATPPPFVHAAPSEPDVWAKANAKRQRRVRQVAAVVAGGLGVVAITFAVIGFGSKSEPAPARAAVVVREAPPVVQPVPVAAPAPVAPIAPAALAASPAPPSTSVAASAPSPPAHKGHGSKAHHAKASHASHGPKLMKVNSGGT